MFDLARMHLMTCRCQNIGSLSILPSHFEFIKPNVIMTKRLLIVHIYWTLLWNNFLLLQQTA